MTKIIILEELQNERPTVTFNPGQVIEVPDTVAERLIIDGKAVKYASTMPPTTKGVIETARRKPQTQKSKK